MVCDDRALDHQERYALTRVLQSQGLKSFCLSGCRISESVVEALATSLGHAHHLERIHFKHLPLSRYSENVLARGMANNFSLTSLEIERRSHECGSHIRGQVPACCQQILKRNKDLQHLRRLLSRDDMNDNLWPLILERFGAICTTRGMTTRPNSDITIDAVYAACRNHVLLVVAKTRKPGL